MDTVEVVEDLRRTPLTLDEVKAKGLSYYIYNDDVYDYETKYGYTLVQYGKVLCQDVIDCFWHEDNIYEFENDKGYTLMNGDTVLCENVKDCWWHGDGRYWYKTHDGEKFTKTTS